MILYGLTAAATVRCTIIEKHGMHGDRISFLGAEGEQEENGVGAFGGRTVDLVCSSSAGHRWSF